MSDYSRVRETLKTISGHQVLEPPEAYTVNNPSFVRSYLGRVLRYFEVVESAVPQTARDVSLYTGDDEQIAAFADLWVPQEVGHGTKFAKVTHALDIPLYERPDEPPSTTQQFIHAVSSRCSSVRDIMKTVVVVRGALHERTTAVGYNLLGQTLRNNQEAALAQELTQPILPQESAHLAYYKAASDFYWQLLSPWQQKIVRHLTDSRYEPVGVESDERRRDFGHIVLQLCSANSKEVSTLVDPVSRLAGVLLKCTDELPSFVSRSIQHCIEAYRSEGDFARAA